MKTYKEIMEEIKANAKKVKSLEAEAEQIQQDIKALLKQMTPENKEDIFKQYDPLKAKQTALKDRINHLHIVHKILNSNALISMKVESLPFILEIFAKYNGKPYGDKTKEKISNAIFEKTGFECYVKLNYGSGVYVIYNPERYYDSVEIYPKYNDGVKERLLVGNRIRALRLSDFDLEVWEKEYIEDIPGRINELKELYFAAYDAQQTLNNICSKFNGLKPSTMDNINAYKVIYGSFPY